MENRVIVDSMILRILIEESSIRLINNFFLLTAGRGENKVAMMPVASIGAVTTQIQDYSKLTFLQM